MKKLILTQAIILSSLLFYGCSEQQDTAQTNKSETQTTSENGKTPAQTQVSPTPISTSAENKNFVHPPMPKTNSTAQVVKSHNSGIVEQVLNSGGYTYVKARVDNKSVWLAGSQSPVKEGQTIYWGDYAVMPNFKSKSLDRTFDEILFVSSFSTKEPTAQTSASVNSGKVLSTQNAAGYSYIEVDSNGNTVWIAAPETVLNTGDQIVWNGASKMHNFTSKSLDKTFKEILFVATVNVSK